VCSFSAFDFRRHGNPRWGSPWEGAVRARHGKLERSLVSFAAEYPHWRPEGDARAALEHLAQGAAEAGVGPGAAGGDRAPGTPQGPPGGPGAPPAGGAAGGGRGGTRAGDPPGPAGAARATERRAWRGAGYFHTSRARKFDGVAAPPRPVGPGTPCDMPVLPFPSRRPVGAARATGRRAWRGAGYFHALRSRKCQASPR